VIPVKLEDAHAAGTIPAGVPIRETYADFIYQRFFKAAIVITLTAGCSWGAVNLLQIALGKNFLQLHLVPSIHAHAHAMIFGWVGLFVMGFAYQSFPRFKYATLWRPDLAAATLVMMLAGIIARVAAELLQPARVAFVLAGFAALAELAAIGLFISILRNSLKTAVGPTQPYERFLRAGLLWFFVQAIVSDIFFLAKATAGSTKELVMRIASIDGPLRDLQLLGFAAFMIAGVSLRMIPMAYGLRRGKKDRLGLIFWLMNGSLVLEMASCELLFQTRKLIFAPFLELAYLMMLAWGVLLVRQLGIFTRAAESDRSLKFLRAAYAWLLVAMAMMPFFPLYNRLTGQVFSHSYWGSQRHAFTVGFISMMILGVSSRVVPMMSGLEMSRLSSLWGPFLLLNIGSGARVLLQILTDFVPARAYPLLGFSGFIEVIALAWWGFELWRAMGLARTHRAQLFGVAPAPASR
jgi:hypothetical protein